ncbi:MAG: heavy-metal-associated domain-containing protein [Acidobacteria bacterium]|nr:heavy-metal-associated domain-containing protein [Acidobacteriota bacterium]
MKGLSISIFLLLVLGLAAWVTLRPTPASSDDKAAGSPQLEKVVFKVEGMTCGGCAMGVKRTLEKQTGVQKAEVSLEKGEAIAEVEKGRVNPTALAAAVTRFGYKTTVLKVN